MRLIYYYILFIFISFEYSQETFFTTFEINESIIEKIESGKIVTIKTNKDYGDGLHYQVYGIVDANLDEVFNAIENFDDYKEFMPRFEHAEPIMIADSLIAYIFNITLPMKIKYKYKIKIKKSITKSIAWLAWETIDWEENSIEETWGQWYLEPYGASKNKTLIQYQVYTDPGYIPFGFAWIIDLLTKSSLPETVENLKEWVEKNEN